MTNSFSNEGSIVCWGLPLPAAQPAGVFPQGFEANQRGKGGKGAADSPFDGFTKFLMHALDDNVRRVGVEWRFVGQWFWGQIAWESAGGLVEGDDAEGEGGGVRVGEAGGLEEGFHGWRDGGEVSDSESGGLDQWIAADFIRTRRLVDSSG